MAGRGDGTASLGPAVEAAVEHVREAGRQQTRAGRVASVPRLAGRQLQGVLSNGETGCGTDRDDTDHLPELSSTTRHRRTSETAPGCPASGAKPQPVLTGCWRRAAASRP